VAARLGLESRFAPLTVIAIGELGDSSLLSEQLREREHAPRIRRALAKTIVADADRQTLQREDYRVLSPSSATASTSSASSAAPSAPAGRYHSTIELTMPNSSRVATEASMSARTVPSRWASRT